MESHIFYQTKETNSIELILVQGLGDVSSDDVTSVTVQQFEAKSGQTAFIGDDTGKLIKAYVGYSDGDEKAAIAKALTNLPEGVYKPHEQLLMSACVVWALAQYAFDAYQKPKREPRVLILAEAMESAVLAETSATFLVRDLINSPPNHLGPTGLSNAVKQLAESHDAKFEEIVGDDLLDENYPAIYAVGISANEAPRLAILKWGDETHPKVSLVGKGVTFDSGGLDIKPSRAMRNMKKDMGGAAHMIGLAHWIMSLKLPIYLELYIPAVENAISRDAYRPGDVINMRNGLTVEIDNTDAEGRLVLADALSKACENHPDLLIDFSTLTGAARIAVGTEITAMFCNDDAFASSVLASSEKIDDPVWRLPLFQKYKTSFDSKIADLANSAASGYGGAITAALFLERFVTPEIPWMHCDLMAWNLKSSPGKPEGGEAMGIQSVMHYLEEQYS